MSLSKIEKQILTKIKKFTIDEFYINKGPNLSELFIELISQDDLVVNYEYNRQNGKIYNKSEISSDISGFICAKMDDIIYSIHSNKTMLERLEYKLDDSTQKDKEILKWKKEIDTLKKENEKLENEISAAVSLCYMITNKFIDIEKRRNNVHYSTKAYSSESKNDYDTFLKKSTNNTTIVPEKWREYILKIFGTQIKHFSGALLKREDGFKNLYLELRMFNLLALDIQVALAIKNAIYNNSHIIVNDNVIALYLSGGLMALISFRKKAQILTEIQVEENELFRVVRNQHLNKFITLYSISGYQNSEIKINTPDQYYILTKEYVIEITLEPAPILIESNHSIFKGSSDLASLSKRAVEIKEEEEMMDDD